MPKQLCIDLSDEERQKLEWVRDHHALPHVREKAAAILKIAAGQSGRDVALHGLLRPRALNTVYQWVRRYRDEGVDGFLVRSGRGHKPAFSPSARDGRRRKRRTSTSGAS